MKRLMIVAWAAMCVMAGEGQAAEPVDLDVVAKIRHEAFNRSQAATRT